MTQSRYTMPILLNERMKKNIIKGLCFGFAPFCLTGGPRPEVEQGQGRHRAGGTATYRLLGVFREEGGVIDKAGQHKLGRHQR